MAPKVSAKIWWPKQIPNIGIFFFIKSFMIGIAYFPVFSPPISGDKCRNGAATICAVDDECGTNASSLLGTHAKSDKCLYVGEGILSKIVTYGGKIYANIAGKSDTGSDLIEKDSIGMEVDITRGTWKENF